MFPVIVCFIAVLAAELYSQNAVLSVRSFSVVSNQGGFELRLNIYQARCYNALH